MDFLFATQRSARRVRGHRGALDARRNWWRHRNREAQSAGQNHLGRLVGPWWYLKQKIYQQRYNFYNGPVIIGANPPAPLPPIITLSTPRVILNCLALPTPWTFEWATTGQQIADAINWAISLGAPMKLGVTEPSTQPCTDFQQGITCEEVVKKMFRLEPDFVVDWDYSTLPLPTIHFRKCTGATMVPVTIDLTKPTGLENVTIKERPDWRRSYVRIYYDQTNTVSGPGGGTYLNIFPDVYPNPIPAGVEAQFRGVDLFVDLMGGQGNLKQQQASFTSVPFDVTNIETWQKWCPALIPAAPENGNKGTVYQAEIETGANPAFPAPTLTTDEELLPDGSPAPIDPTCLYAVVDGEWADWLENLKPPIRGQRLRATCFVKVTHMNGTMKTVPYKKDFTAVSLNTGGVNQDFFVTTYDPTQYAESLPVGLAQAMWQSWQNLAIEGKLKNVEAVVGNTFAITRSNVLNFLTTNPGANGRPDWRNAKALVQSIRGNLENGQLEVAFGAPLRVTGHELIDAVRATRYRFVLTNNLAFYFGGQLSGGAETTKPARKTHASNSEPGPDHTGALTISDTAEPTPGTDAQIEVDGKTGITKWSPENGPIAPPVTLDPNGAKGSDGNWHPVQLQEITVCVSGVAKKMIVFGSNPF